MVYNFFILGMEDYLLEIFGGYDIKEVIYKGIFVDFDLNWMKEVKVELNKVFGFVRGKVKWNIEKFVRECGILDIFLEVMYAVKEVVGV